MFENHHNELESKQEDKYKTQMIQILATVLVLRQGRRKPQG